MLEIASQMVLCLLLAALLGFIIGYLLGKSNCSSDIHCDTEETHHEEEEDHHEEVAPLMSQVSDEEEVVVSEEEIPSGVAPELLSGPREGQKDNLTRIKGIGLKIEEILNNQGIYHFDQIANWNEENIKWVDKNIAFPGRVEREQWVEQAKLLAEGKETEFSKRVDAGEVASSKKG